MKQNRYSYIYPLTAGALFLVFWLLYFLHPSVIDDRAFTRPMTAFMENPSLANFFAGWKQNIYERFIYDNMRLPQLISSGFLMLPKWATAAVYAGAVMLMFVLAARLSDLWRKRFLLYTLLCSALYVGMPWFEHMFVGMLNLNYIVPSALLLWAFGMLVKQRPRSEWLAGLLGLLVGWMHEAFGAAAIGGVVFAMLLPSMRTRRNVFFIVGAVAALLFLGLLVPGTKIRGEYFAFPHDLDGLIYSLRYTLRVNLLFYIYAIVFAIAAIKKSTRHLAFNAVPLICLGASLAGATVFFCCLVIRAAWPMLLMSYVGLFYFLSQLICPRFGFFKLIVSCLLWVGIILQGLLCVPWFVKYKKLDELYLENSSLYEQHRSVFADYPTTLRQPLYTLSRPHPGTFAQYVRVAVPYDLADFTPEQALRVGGDDIDPYWLYKDNIITTYPGYDGIDRYNIWADGKPHYQYSILIPFQVGDNTYAFVNPHAFFFESKLNKWRSGVVLDSIERLERTDKYVFLW